MKSKLYYFPLIVLVGVVLISSCSTNSSIPEIDYDEVVHFKYDEEKFGTPDSHYDDGDKSFPLLFDLPDSLDANLPAKLEQYGYIPSPLAKGNFSKLNSIFECEVLDENAMTDCAPIYRDILLFEKQNEIVLVAQICFQCGHARFIGPWPNMTSFGQKGEFKQLKALLDESTH